MAGKKSEITRKIRNWLIIHLGSRLFKMWFATCRLEIRRQDLYERYGLGDGGTVGATWHRGALYLVWFFRKLRPMVMFSSSRDGDLLAGFAEKVGVIPIRGSSTRGGAAALRGMIDFLRMPGPRKAATVLDGPRGPRCVAKKGMIVLAKEAGVPLAPLMMSARPAVTLKKTWDRTLIPLPFSRVVVLYRDPWHIPKDISEDQLEALRVEVENTLNDMMREADEITGYRDS